MGNDKKDAKTALAGGALVLSTAALITALTRKVEVAPPEIPPKIIAVLEDEVKQALAAILGQQIDMLNALTTVNSNFNIANQRLAAMLTVLGAEVPVEEPILEPFKKVNETLEKGVPFSVYEKTGKGALIWAIFDVSDPDTKLHFRIDDLLWEFKFNTLLTQGIQQPLFPGAWLSKADAISGHYCIIFSAGTLAGFAYKQRLIISLTFEGTGTATLHEARGIKWTYP